MEVCVVGPLVVLDGTTDVPIGGLQHRRLLGRLALAAGRAVPVGAIESALWGDSPPASARHTIATRIFQLRARGIAIATLADGYALLDPIDAVQLERAVRDGRATDGGAAARNYSRAIGLWRGRPYPELDELADAQVEATRLTDLVDEARELLLTVQLDIDEPGDSIPDARRLTVEQPYRERRWELLMLALYRAGRQAEALTAYAECRRLLVDDLGIEPGPGLRRMQQAILAQDPRLDAPPRSASAADAAGGADADAGADTAGGADAGAVAGGAAVDAVRGSGREPSPGPRGSRVPGTSTRLIGRDHELAELAEVWDRARLATISGPPGAGKTRLALEIARRESDPVWYVELEQLAADRSVASAILEGMAPSSHAPDAAAGVIAVIGAGGGLLVLDGCESRHVDVATEVAELLAACPAIRILVTSRERLGLLDQALIPIAGLTDGQSVELLVDRARLLDPDYRLEPADAVAADELCALVDRLPLGIELVARHLQLLRVPDVRDRVASDLGRWAGAPAGGRVGLRAAMAASLARLASDETEVLLALAVMAAAADPALIAETAGFPPTTDRADDIFDIVARLVDSSLVQVRSAAGPARYEVLRTVAAFSLESAAAADVDAARRRYRDAVLVRAGVLAARVTTSERSEAVLQLDNEMGHVRAALGMVCAAPVDVAAARRGVELAVVLSDYWLSRRPVEGVDWLERLIGAAAPEPALLARARLRQAHLAYWVTDFERGRTAADAARGLYAQLGDTAGEGLALRRLGAIAAATDEMVQARTYLEASLHRLDQAGQEQEVATTLLHLGSLLADEGAFDEAVPLLERALAIVNQRDDPLASGQVLAALTTARWKAGDLEPALEVGEQALNLFRGLGHRPSEGMVAYRLSAIARGLGRPRAARRYAQLSIDAGEQIQTRSTLALGHVTMARLDLDSDEVAAAAEHLLVALRHHDPIADRWVLVEVLEATARLLIVAGRPGAPDLLVSAAAMRQAIRQPVSPTERADVEWAMGWQPGDRAEPGLELAPAVAQETARTLLRGIAAAAGLHDVAANLQQSG